ncbi:hypothetical protein B0H13DRAFT_2305200 [Mycena leptocephala]|nr:hypothetical protein B0H13DRAFT_2305200 [Mycena leptocephala]
MDSADRGSLTFFGGVLHAQGPQQLQGREQRDDVGVETACAIGPVLLANKENAALLRNLLDPAQAKDAVLTEDQFPLRFPDTSNTRFGSHGDAAGELITYLLQYREIMELIEWSKQNPSLTNIEKNLRDALNDIPTLTELAAMTIYKMVITHPYLRQAILDNPDIIFGADVAHETALTTWTRFSAEFAPGGLIDTCTATERQLAWMPSTNDANEGALGAYRVAIRGKPSLTLHQYNAQAMFRRNDTQNFMDAVFTDEDHAYIMREARRIDASGEEARRREQIVDFRIKTAEMHKTKAAAKVQKEARDLQDHLTRVLVPMSKMDDLTIPLIHDQLNSYRARGVPDILVNSKYPRKADKLAALKVAFTWYEVQGSPIVVPEVPRAFPALIR